MNTATPVVVMLLSCALAAQETKPVPKGSSRVFVPGCSRGLVFTAGTRIEDQPGTVVPEGTHLRMNGPKKLIDEIKAQEGSKIEITGLIKNGQIPQDGVRIGRGVRVTGGSSPGGGLVPNPGISPIVIDVEGWRRVLGDCSAR